MRPLGVEEVEGALLLLREAPGGVVPLAPGRHDEVAARFEDARHLADVVPLVGHVLAALAAPDDVKGVVVEGHGEGVHDPEVGVGDAPRLGEGLRARDLFLRQGDAQDLGAPPELVGHVPRRAADAAADVQDLERRARGRRERVDPAPLHHALREIVLGLDEVLPQVAPSHLLVRVVAQVDVLPPVVLEDALPRPGVVLPADRVRRAIVRPRGPIQPPLDRDRAHRRDQDGRRPRYRVGHDRGGEGRRDEALLPDRALAPASPRPRDERPLLERRDQAPPLGGEHHRRQLDMQTGDHHRRHRRD
mmetsp:Transcript_5153/g.15640  ORF Transcript_5153/g.15640 Transcript_5153/m.15640 type:complete len:304 (+) Transcript_5153:468-1379(+)